MILKRGQSIFKLPEALDANSCQFAIWSDDPKTDPGAYLFSIPRVSYDELAAMAAKSPVTHGMPAVFAISLAGHKPQIEMWPKPHAKLHAQFRYCPVMKEI